MSVSPSLSDFQKRSEHFLNQTGRRPRILLSCIEGEGSPGRLKALAVVMADVGFDVDIAPVFSTHGALAKMACENDVHLVGISGWTRERADLKQQITQALADLGEENIKIHVEREETVSHQLVNPEDAQAPALRYAQESLTLLGA
jgi:methylmalonyl-CoA mutase